MILEVSLVSAGAVSLMAHVYGAKIEDVYVTGYSVMMVLDDGVVGSRTLVEQCKRQGLLYEH